MAQQHYEGKKHRRNAARARLLEQLAGSLDATECTGQTIRGGQDLQQGAGAGGNDDGCFNRLQSTTAIPK